MANNTYIQTVSGVQPNQDTQLEFTVSTQAAETFIRDRFKDLTEARRRTGSFVPKIDYEDIKVRSMTYSKRFAPFLLIVPDAIVDRKEYDPNTPAMFQNTDAVLPIIDDYFTLIQGFSYKSDDIKQVRESSFTRRNLGLEGSDINEFAYYAKFRTKPLNCDNEYANSNLLFIEIDPGRVFHAMLKNRTAPNQRFNVTITNVILTGGNSAIYKVSRSPINRKDNKNAKKERDRVVEILANSVNL